jgi:hypothetical protein
VREVPLPEAFPADAGSFLACLATVLELPLDRLPALEPGEDPADGWTVSRWLGGLGLGLARVADPRAFSWAGPWIARLRPPGGERRAVVMFGVPSGLVWDPAGDGRLEQEWIEEGFLVAASDVALALPPRPAQAPGEGTIEGIWIASSAGVPASSVESVKALAGRGLEGDRHVAGTGTFPSGPSGSALTLIEAEVCESFDAALAPDEHRRNVVTRGVELNRLVGRDFSIGEVRCRGVRLCEPCAVVQSYAGRPVLRALVHRGGLRADILANGTIRVGDAIRTDP